jgi:hypothetical protein
MRGKRNPVLAGLALVMAMVLVACGGQPGPKVAKVVIKTGSVLLENVGATQQLSAQALDNQGNPVAASITWESSKPANVSVDAQGVARGVAVGSSQLRAVVGSVKSAPVIAAVGALADDVVRISDDKVVSGPSFGNGCGPFEVGCQYTAVLKEVSPAAGKLWFSKAPDGSPVQGRVVSSQPVAEGIQVTFEVVPIGEIFKDLKVDETVDLPSDELEVSEAVRANYNVQRRPDGSYEFTPKAGSAGIDPLDFENSILKCKGNMPPTTVTFGQPSFTLNMGNPRLEFRFQAPIPFVTAGFVRFLFTANPSVRINSGTHTINSNFNNLSLRCTFKNGISQPFQVLGLGFTAKLVPGVTIGGSYGAGSRSFSARLNATSNVRLGFDCRPPAGCTNLTQGNGGSVQGVVTLSGLGNLASTIRDLNAGAFGDVSILADVPVLGSFNLFEFIEGYGMDFDLASLQTQINENNPADYLLSHYLEIDPFAAIKSLVNFLLGSGAANSLGLDPINLDLASLRSPLVQSATAVSSASGSTVTVKLDPNRINFFGTVPPFSLLYNVQRVQLIRKGTSGTLINVQEQTASSGQTTFTFSLSPGESLQDLFATIIPVVLSEIPVGTAKVQVQ